MATTLHIEQVSRELARLHRLFRDKALASEAAGDLTLAARDNGLAWAYADAADTVRNADKRPLTVSYESRVVARV